jgi:hypothetical protein
MDYLATVLWGGRLTVSGVADNGELVLLGQQREALTARYYNNSNPNTNLDSKQLYREPIPVVFPSPVLVFATDNISNQFDGVNTTFSLTRGSLTIPPSQLLTESVLVQLGAVVQKPAELVGSTWVNGSYWIDSATSNINFTTPPLAGTTCEIRVLTTDDEQKTLTVVSLVIENATRSFDGVSSNYTLIPTTGSAKCIPVNTQNTFVLLSGTEQLPTNAYTLSKSASNVITISFTGVPPVDLEYDIRVVTSGSYYTSQFVYPVEVYSFDDISPLFNSTQTEFPLTYGGVAVDSTVVTAENLFVSLGGAIQLPPQKQFNPVTGVETLVPGAYTVSNGRITFNAPPLIGTTCNMRFFGESEFITCPLPGGLSSEFVKWGPGVVLDLRGQMEVLDPGIIP